MTGLLMSEADFQKRVTDYATLRGWRWVHIRPARTAHGWTVPYDGDHGLPDLILSRRSRVLLVELKSARGTATADQLAWLAALGEHGRLWTPAHWDDVLEDLR